MTKFTADQANTFLRAAFPEQQTIGTVLVMEEGFARMELVAGPQHLRPGGYISGPTQMSLADSVAYMAVMTITGHEPMTVTSNLSINFLRPCIGDTLVAEARILKCGKTSAVMDVDLRAKGAAKPASHCVVTYAIPATPSGMA